MEVRENIGAKPSKKTWIKPELEVLDVRQTEYWEFGTNPETGFPQWNWVNES